MNFSSAFIRRLRELKEHLWMFAAIFTNWIEILNRKNENILAYTRGKLNLLEKIISM